MVEPAAITALPLGRDARYRSLLEAQRSITSDLPLDEILRRIVRTACTVSGARYGALGVIGADGQLEQFLHHGSEPAILGRRRRPRGRGAPDGGAGTPLTEVTALPDVTSLAGAVAGALSDAAGAASRAGAPPPRNFLAVPIRIRGEVFGDLYLADPVRPSGQAGRGFDAEDEQLVLSLAAAAGTAIENARLYHAARRSERWLHASGEVARALLAGADVDMLHEIVTRAVGAGEADYGQLMLPTDDGQLQISAAHGIGAEALLGNTYAADYSAITEAIVSAQPLSVSTLTEWTGPDFDNRAGYGPALLVPLVDARGSRGALMLIRLAGRPVFSAIELVQASTYANQVALALQFADARADTEWLQVLEVRHKLAQDLHDNVMQRLFATGVGLQGLLGSDLDPTVGQRLQRYVGELDETIDEIRARVFGLRAEDGPRRRARSAFPHLGPTPPGRRGAGTVRRDGSEPRRGRRRSDWSGPTAGGADPAP